jgi:hypothetical protein
MDTTSPDDALTGAIAIITINNGTIPRDWKKAMVVPIHKAGDRLVVKNYRPISLASVVCKQMEHVIAGYMRQVWENSDWLYEGQHGFRLGYLCESKIITVCQGIADSIEAAVKTGHNYNRLLESISSSPSRLAAQENCSVGSGPKSSGMIKVRVFFRLRNLNIVGFLLFIFTELHVSVLEPSSSTHIFHRIYSIDNGSVVVFGILFII